MDVCKDHLEGTPNPFESNQYFIADYTLYKNTITKMLEDKFGAESKHTNKANKIIFNMDKLRKLEKTYNTQLLIRTRLIEEGKDESEGSEGSEGSWEDARPSEEVPDDKYSHIDDKKDVNILQNEAVEEPKTPLAYPQMPSQPSHLSPSQEVDNVASLKEYERLSAKSRENSKAAVNVGPKKD